MIHPLTWLSKKRFPYRPLISIEISKSCLINNLKEFLKLAPEGKIAPVLKSNAYGHGLLEIAGILEQTRKKDLSFRNALPFFVVDSFFEAVALRAKWIRTPLLIIGYSRPETIIKSRLSNVSYAISSIDSLERIQETGHDISIHLKIDTGMHRQGILPEELDKAVEIIKSNKKIKLEGICSHLSDSDNQDSSFTKSQIAIWNNLVSTLTSLFPEIKYIHLSATCGHHYSDLIKANVSRLGLGLYGLANCFKEELSLKPVLQMKTIVTGIKKIRKGDLVGYDKTFMAEKDMAIATFPIGYYEGLDRKLSNTGFVEILPHRVFCPIIGRVSMNITCTDVSAVENIRVGDEVVVISRKWQDKNSINSISKICGHIEYETAIHIPEHLKRTVVD